MRLGLWNRLAIVATGLFVVFAPIWIMRDMAVASRESGLRGSKLCHDYASAKLKTDIRDHKAITFPKDATDCYNEDDHRFYYQMNWNDWLVGAAGSLAFCAAIYALIWLAVFATRWVWAGRKVPIAK